MDSIISILGIRIHNLGKAEALEGILGMVAEGTPHHVVTVNPEFAVLAHQDPSFRDALNQADLALADGVGISWAALLTGHRIRARLPGVDLMERLAELAAQRGYRFYLLGARPGVAEGAARALAARYPGLRIAGVYAGSPRPEEEEAIIERVRAAAPHFLFVAYGAPQQDLWIRRNLARLGVPMTMGVGGSLDYLSGVVPRAPSWMRRMGLEWLFRLLREPWRWRRMLRLPLFLWLVLTTRGSHAVRDPSES